MEKKDIQLLIEVLGRGVRERELFKNGLEIAQSLEGLFQFEKELKDRVEKAKSDVTIAINEKEKVTADPSFVKTEVASAKTEARAILDEAKKKAQTLINDVQLKAEVEKQKAQADIDLIQRDIKDGLNQLANINVSIAAASDELAKLQKRKEEFLTKLASA